MNLITSLHIEGREPFGKAHGPGTGGITISLFRAEMCDPMLRLIWSSAPANFPKLNWALVEGGIGWIANALGFMDHWWHDHRGWLDPKLQEPPSHYCHRQFYATFENDRAGIMTRELLGVKNLLWGSDYPHTEGVWPFSRRTIGRSFRVIDTRDTRRMTRDNAVSLYGFDAE